MRRVWSFVAMTGAVLVAGLITLGVTGRLDQRFDWTSDARFSLSVGSQQIVAELDAPVELVAFTRAGSQEADHRRLSSLLETYAAASSQITTRIVNPDAEPALRDEFRVQSDPSLFVVAGERREEVGNASEAEITRALVRMTSRSAPAVWMLAGHGERALDDPSPAGWSQLRQQLVARGVSPRVASRERGLPAPDERSLVVVANPAVAWTEADAEWLDEVLAAGGAVWVGVEPDGPPTVRAWLAQHGVEVVGPLTDPRTRIYGADDSVPVVTDYEKHPITDELRQSSVIPTFFPGAAALRGAPGADVRPLLLASPTARIEDQPVVERPALAVLAANDRLFVVGDADFASNACLALSGNQLLAIASLEWLTEGEDAAPVLVAGRESPRLLTRDEFAWRVTAPALAVPGLFLFLGVLGNRRRR